MKLLLAVILSLSLLRLCNADVYYADAYIMTDDKPFIANCILHYTLMNEIIVDEVAEMKQHCYAYAEHTDRMFAIEAFRLNNKQYLVRYWKLQLLLD